MLVWQLVAAASGADAYDSFQGFAGSWVGILVLLAWSASLFYHLLNGIRHLVWDAGFGFELSETYKSGRYVIIGTVALTLISWIWALAAWGGK
jgi:succinate dehydrogenase / fumarate reductase cytochrome b subunit